MTAGDDYQSFDFNHIAVPFIPNTADEQVHCITVQVFEDNLVEDEEEFVIYVDSQLVQPFVILGLNKTSIFIADNSSKLMQTTVKRSRRAKPTI